MFGAKGARESTDKILAGAMKAESATAVQALGAFIATTSCADLKRLFTDFLQQDLIAQAALDVFIADKGWSKPNASSDEMLHMAMQDVNSVMNSQV